MGSASKRYISWVAVNLFEPCLTCPCIYLIQKIKIGNWAVPRTHSVVTVFEGLIVLCARTAEVKASRDSSGVERFLGKEEVGGSNPLLGSKFMSSTVGQHVEKKDSIAKLINKN